MEKEKLVIVGAGMAAVRLVEELVAAAPNRFAITVIGEEPRLAYNRVLLSSALAGEVDVDEIELKPAQWWRAAGVEVLSGRKATEIDVSRRAVLLENGAHINYSKLVLATGSRAIRLPIEGAELEGVHTFRDAGDVEKLSRLGAAGQKVVVIGGGLLGLEAAYGLVRRGGEVTLLHVMDRLMERQLDAAGAAMLRRLVEARGVRVTLAADTARIKGRGRVERVELADGSVICADAVVFAVGVRPNAELAGEAGLSVNRGVIVDDGLATSDEDIFAIGECAEHRGVCYGVVEPAYEQARVLARRLVGLSESYCGSVVSTNLKVSGVRVFSAGDYEGGSGTQCVLCSDPRMGVYRKLLVDDDRLRGAILIGDTQGALSYLDLIRSGASVGAIREDLMFGVASLKEAA